MLEKDKDGLSRELNMEGADASPDANTLAGYISEINEMSSAGKLAELDRQLGLVVPSSVSIPTMICVLRSTFSVRSSLTHWEKALDSVKIEVKRRGDDTERLLVGLIAKQSKGDAALR